MRLLLITLTSVLFVAPRVPSASPVNDPIQENVTAFRLLKSAGHALQVTTVLAPSFGTTSWANYYKARHIDINSLSFQKIRFSGNSFFIPGTASPFHILNQGRTIEHDGKPFTWDPKADAAQNIQRMTALWTGTHDASSSFLFPSAHAAEDPTPVQLATLGAGATAGLTAAVVAAWNNILYIGTGQEIFGRVAWRALGVAAAIGVVTAALVYAERVHATSINAKFECGPKFIDQESGKDITSDVFSNLNDNNLGPLPDAKSMITGSLESACAKDRVATEKGIAAVIDLLKKRKPADTKIEAVGPADILR